jgi:hypothetical protein
MAVSTVAITADALQVCLAHALSTEKEEIMGLLLGDVIDSTPPGRPCPSARTLRCQPVALQALCGVLAPLLCAACLSLSLSCRKLDCAHLVRVASPPGAVCPLRRPRRDLARAARGGVRRGRAPVCDHGPDHARHRVVPLAPAPRGGPLARRCQHAGHVPAARLRLRRAHLLRLQPRCAFRAPHPLRTPPPAPHPPAASRADAPPLRARQGGSRRPDRHAGARRAAGRPRADGLHGQGQRRRTHPGELRPRRAPPPPPPPSPSPCTNWTRLVLPLVLIGHAASLTPY